MTVEYREVRVFLHSQAFADGVRATVAILLPALIGLYTNRFEAGLTVSLGAMCVNLVDAPGPFIHKRNGMFVCTAVIFLVALLTSVARLNVYTMGVAIALVCFFFSMFSVYGNRAGGIGSAAILVMILTMDQPVEGPGPLVHSAQILAGGMFYTALSLSLYKLRPYRISQRALGESIREIATYLSIKADFYNSGTDLASDYRNMVHQQIVVQEKQEAVREILFKTRQMVEESTVMGRKLVLTFVETVDLFEDITATYYDYAQMREQFAGTGVLERIAGVLKQMANELDNIGIGIQADTGVSRSVNYDTTVRELKVAIDNLDPGITAKHVLKRILVNIRRLLNGFNRLHEYFEEKDAGTTGVDHGKFISHQSFTPKIFWDNLSLQSSVFRHSLRVAIGCVAGFLIAKVIAYGHHSYWILLTVAFILKPAFSLTKQRNIQRIWGTLLGGGIGVLILLFIPNKTVLFIAMVLLMLGTYSFLRTNYLLMVICTTPYVLILFRFLGVGFIDLAGERILDTAIGCVIAFSLSNFLLPTWEADQFRSFVRDMLRANSNYLVKVLEALAGRQISGTEYKLARKEVYVASANLSSAFQRILSEPKSKQAGKNDMHQFVVLNHLLFSNVASISKTLMSQPPKTYPPPLLIQARKSIDRLKSAMEKANIPARLPHVPAPEVDVERQLTTEEKVMKDQLAFIGKLGSDIEKATAAII